jgi:hypothetical protein
MAVALAAILAALRRIPSAIYLFKDKQYYFYIHLHMTIFTSESNCGGQLDNCYVIVEVVCVVLSV